MTGGVQEANGMRVAEQLLRANGVIPPDEVWVHGMWTPRVWKECLGALRAGRPLVRMTHGSLSPIYLERQSKWKKRLVSPIERALFARTARVVVTGPWEEEWCRRWGIKCPIQTVDLKHFFNFPQPPRGLSPQKTGGQTPQEARGQSPQEVRGQTPQVHGDSPQKDMGTVPETPKPRNSETPRDPTGTVPETSKLRNPETSKPLGGQSPRLKVLYLGRIHPLKGVDVLREAVEGLDVDLRVESEVFGEEKERALEWCDVLVLPSMSENFGFVVAEALMHGKRAVATDGAPAWENQEGVAYVRGYRDAPHDEQIRLLREALKCEIMGGAR